MSTTEQPALTVRRVHTGELISATSALVLLPIMFLLEWYGIVGVPRSERSGVTGVVNAWHELTYVRWLLILTIVVAVGQVALHASQRQHGGRTDTSRPVAALGTISALLLIYRVLIDPPNPSTVVDIKIGAFLGVMAALGIALGGWESIRDARERRGRLAHRARRHEVLASRPQPR